MEIEVYTSMPTPFALGGTEAFIKTNIEEYERVDIGAGFFGLIFQNVVANLWHIAQEDCGALIGSDKSKTKLIKKVKNDVSSGDPKLMKEQIKMGKSQMSRAHKLERGEWLGKFRKG